jgi:hypothetical protein
MTTGADFDLLMCFSASSLYRGLNNGRKFASTSRVEYLAVSEMFGRERVLAWSKQSTTLELKNGEWISVYRHPKSKGLLSCLRL